MIDKFIVLSPNVAKDYRQLAGEEGWSSKAYRRVVDLEEGEATWGRLYCGGRWNNNNKLELYNTASMGWPRCEELIRGVFPEADRVSIYRIDPCVDLWGIHVKELAQNVFVPRVQSLKLIRSRGAWSFYLRASDLVTTILYDKAREAKARNGPLAALLRAEDEVTRLETQLKGRAVPFKKLSNMQRYADYNPFESLKFAKLRVPTTRDTAISFLVHEGLRHVVRKYGLQAASKHFSPGEWAVIRTRYFEPMQSCELPDIAGKLRRSTTDWLAGRIRFPRAPDVDS